MEESLNSLQKDDVGERALEILKCIAYFSPDDIYSGMFASLVGNTKKLKLVLDALKRHKFVECYIKRFVIRIDSSIQTGIRMYLKEQKGEEEALCLAVKLLNRNMECENTLNHAVSVFGYSKEYSNNVKLVNELSVMGGHVILGFIKQKRCAEGRVFGYDVLDFAKRVLGEQHLETLKLQHNLGSLLEAEGKFEEAANLLLSLFEIDKDFCALNDVPITLVKIAKSLSESSPTKTLPFYDKLLRGSPLYYTNNKILKAIHLHSVQEAGETVLTQKAVGILLQYLEKTRNTTNLCKYHVKKRTVEHGDLVMSTLGHLYMKIGDSRNALKTLKFIYNRRSLNLGAMHPDTLKSKRDLALPLIMEDNHDEAIKLLSDVVEELELVLGELHPDSIAARIYFARSLSAQWQKMEDAYSMFKDVYMKLRLLCGEFHIETLKVKHNMGTVLLKLGKKRNGMSVLREVLEGYRKVLGPYHKDTLEVMEKVDLSAFYKLFSEDNSPKTIHSLLKDGNYEEVSSLIENGEDINAQDAEGKSPLHYAVEHNHMELVELLLEKGAAYDVKNMDRKTPLQIAKDPKIKELLNSVKTMFIDVKAGNPKRIAEFHSVMKWIVNVKDSTGHSPLHWAAFKGHQEVLLLLLELGADATSVSHKGNSSLHVAVSKGHGEMVKTLLQFVRSDDMNDFINGRTKAGGTSPLHVAAERGFLDIVKTLVKNGAAYDIHNTVGKTPLELAEDGNVRNLLQLVDSLFTDARNGSADIVKKLRDLDLDVLLLIKNALDHQNSTVLETAVKKHQGVVGNLQEILKSPFQKS